MPTYHFKFQDDSAGCFVELANDGAAWRELIALTSDILKDSDGRLPDQSHMELSVHDGDQCIGNVKVFAVRGSRSDGH